MNAEDLPIDINYNKLSDWLVSRRHCQPHSDDDILTIRKKINLALQDMPEVSEISELLSGSYINYFHCQRIIELLKETEKDSKNIFGWYSSKRMKDWQEIVKLYEKDAIYLAEASQLLARNVNYEIPAIKRQIAKCQQIQNDCTRKEAEYYTSEGELKEKYQQQCKHMNIQGKSVKRELVELVCDLPTFLDGIGRALTKLGPHINFYQEFVAFTLNSSVHGEACLPMLKYILNKGNTTVYEHRTGKTPSSIENITLDFGSLEEENSPDEEIDWGSIDVMENESAAEIGYLGDPGGENVDIDWVQGDTGEVDIEIVEDSGIKLQSSQDEGIARGTDALTLLDFVTTRNSVIDELYELSAFLSHRFNEITQPGQTMTTGQLDSAPVSILIDSVTISQMQDEVTRLLDQLISPRMRELFLIRGSPKYVDRVCEGLSRILDSSRKMASLAKLMVLKRQEALSELSTLEPKVDLLRTRTHQLKKQMELEISKKYNNRRVNIMGDINTV